MALYRIHQVTFRVCGYAWQDGGLLGSVQDIRCLWHRRQYNSLRILDHYLVLQFLATRDPNNCSHCELQRLDDGYCHFI